jgi:hypothetical protein
LLISWQPNNNNINNNNNNSILYSLCQQLQGQLQTQHSADTNKTKTNYRQALEEDNNNNNNNKFHEPSYVIIIIIIIPGSDLGRTTGFSAIFFNPLR